MNITQRIYARKHRTLRHLRYYHDLTPQDVLGIQGLQLESDEIVFGVYENTIHQRDDSIIITDRGLHYYSQNGWCCIRFQDIATVKFPSRKKKDATKIIIWTKDGKSMDLPVTGSIEVGGGRDALTFWRFLDRVITIDLCQEIG